MMDGNPFADMVTGADATCTALFRTMLTIIAGCAGMAGKGTRARCTESGAGQHNRNEKNEGYFHVGIIIKSLAAAQGIKIGLYPVRPVDHSPISSGGN
jgi:hypothetical protein